MNSGHRIPVIVGVGEYLDKPENPREGLEPLEIILRSVEAADQDAGGGWQRRIDCLRVVNQISWAYLDLPGLLSKRLRLRNVETIYGEVGGETPVRMLVETAMDIADGHSEVALLCGAEALKTAMHYQMAGEKPDWLEEDPDAVLPHAEQYVTAQAALYGLLNPAEVYPLYENALRAASGQSLEEAQAHTAEMWAQMSECAAANPVAWSGRAVTAEAVATPSASNRPISFPYNKFMVAQMAVNQGAAILLTHRDAALAMGISEDRLIYVGSGAGANEPADFLKRSSYREAPALSQTLHSAVEMNGLQTTDIDHYELYSCFPCVPKLAQKALGLAADTAISVTGGLSAFGGPGNNYMTHAIAAMTRELRGREHAFGLLHGNGEFVTKHYASVLSSASFDRQILNANLQPQVDAAYGPVPTVLEDYAGPCRIESYSLTYTTKGEPDRATVIGLTPAGERVVARVTQDQAEELAYLLNPELQAVGTQGVVYDGHDGWQHWGLKLPASLPEPPVLFEKLSEHVALVTLNRPGKRNTVNGAVTRLMCRYVQQIENNPDIRVAILTGAGLQAFCAGADLTEATKRSGDLIAGGNGFGGFVNARRSKPWIAAVAGFALGGGTEFTLACDLAIAADSAIFGLPEVQRGLLAAAGGAYRLPRALPSREAMHWLLTGKTVTAEEAYTMRLVNAVVPTAELLATAIEFAEAIAANAQPSVRESLRIARASMDYMDQELSEMSMQAVLRLMKSQEFYERPKAFLENRPGHSKEEAATDAIIPKRKVNL